LSEDLHADDVFLQLIAPALDRLAHDEAEEALEPIDLPEGGAGQNAIELLTRGLVAVFFRDGPRRAHRHDVHSTGPRRPGLHPPKLSSTLMPSGS
jgi:hypothetical protein